MCQDGASPADLLLEIKFGRPSRNERLAGRGFCKYLDAKELRGQNLHNKDFRTTLCVRRTLFLKILDEVRQAYGFVVTGYVVMPEHIHLLVSEPEGRPLAGDAASEAPSGAEGAR